MRLTINNVDTADFYNGLIADNNEEDLLDVCIKICEKIRSIWQSVGLKINMGTNIFVRICFMGFCEC